ncbi:MAG: hypothetical protein FJW39_28615 [Acidobacteria bacterium]|nr:hypothetical protein [Acidobacteriota bacterium]
MDALLWLLLPLLTSAGSALLAFLIMQARMDVALAKERERLAEARATLVNLERSIPTQVKAAEEEARRKSMDEFLGDFRIEERHYTRENKSLFLKKKSMVLQERLYFRTIPLSNWVEHEMTVEEGGDVHALAKAYSVFTTRAIDSSSQKGDTGAQAGESGTGVVRLLR